MNQSVLVERIVESVLSLDGDAVTGLIRSAVEQNLDLAAVLNSGLTEGLCKLGEGFERGEVFIPELMIGAEIVQSSMEELEPHIETDNLKTKGKLLIGTVAGDLHDVGKNIVCSVFSSLPRTPGQRASTGCPRLGAAG